MVMSMDALGDQTMSSPIDESVSATSHYGKHQESAEEALVQEDEQSSKASGQTVMVDEYERASVKMVETPLIPSSDPTGPDTGKHQGQVEAVGTKRKVLSSSSSAMLVLSRESSIDETQKNTMNVEYDDCVVRECQINRAQQELRPNFDPNDSLVAKMREIVQGNTTESADKPAGSQEAKDQEEICGQLEQQKQETSSKESINASNVTASKRFRHPRSHCSRGHHHHHHRQYSHRPSVATVTSQTSNSGQQHHDHHEAHHRHHQHHHHHHNQQQHHHHHSHSRSTHQPRISSSKSRPNPDVEENQPPGQESKSSTSSTSSPAQQHRVTDQAVDAESLVEGHDRRCTHDPRASTSRQGDQHDHYHHGHHHHRHYHHHHGRHHHHRNHKRRLVLDQIDGQMIQATEAGQTGSSDLASDGVGLENEKQNVEVGQEQLKKLSGDERERDPLQDVTSQSNIASSCHHSHNHGGQHHHHHHHHHHQQHNYHNHRDHHCSSKNVSKHHHHHHETRCEQHAGLDDHKTKEATSSDPVSSEQQRNCHNANHHHRHHHHHHHHHHPRPRPKTRAKSGAGQGEADQEQMAGLSSARKGSRGRVLQCAPVEANTIVREKNDDNVDMNLDVGERGLKTQELVDNGGEVVCMELSHQHVTKGFDAMSPGATDANDNETSNVGQGVVRDETRSYDQLGPGNALESVPCEGKTQATSLSGTTDSAARPTGLMNEPTCDDKSNSTNKQAGNDVSVCSHQTDTLKSYNSSFKGRHQDQLVRQQSSSRENSQKGPRGGNATEERGGTGSGEGARGAGQDGSGPGRSDSQLIECAPQQLASTGGPQHQDRLKQVVGPSVPADRRCRLCWCCCCPCSSLSSKTNGLAKSENKTSPETTSSTPNRYPTRLPNVSLEEIRNWSESFDRLMKCSEGRKIFQDFLRCEYSEENILFWIACEDLKSEKDSKSIATKARDIYEDYISILSAKEVSLDSRVRDIINNNIKKPTSNIFDEAQLQIYTLMHRDSYPRFINSPMYKKLAQIQANSRKTSA